MPPPIETERLRLRPFRENDAAQAYDVLERDPEVWRYDPGFQRSFEQRAELVRKYASTNDAEGAGNLAVIVRETGQLAGYVGLQHYILPTRPLATPEVELFYKLGRAYWGQGIATEACQALLDFAFDTLCLKRIVTQVAADNRGSIALLERLGMRIEPAPPLWSPDVQGVLENPRSQE